MTKIIKQQDCYSCDGRSKSLFCNLQSEELKSINESKQHHHYKPGQYLFYSGNPANGLFCVLSGTIKLEATDDQGKSHMVQVYSDGALLGYRALFSEEPYQSSAIAVEDSEVCFLPKKTILDLLQNNTELGMKFLKQLSQDFRMIEQRLQRVATFAASERIAEALLFLRGNFDGKNWTRKEISEWASTTPETVIRTLAEFEAEGIIAQKGRSIEILQSAKLLEKARIGI